MTQPNEPPPCAYLALVEDLALLDRDVSPSDDEDPCPRPPAWVVRIFRRRPGLETEIHATACEAHERVAHGVAGYVKSIPLGIPPS
jgi:hypothetical protein